MSAPSLAKPLPEPSDLTLPFWQGCRRHELLIQRCLHCRRLLHYPKIVCPHDGHNEFDWVKVSGRGKVHSFVTAHRAFHPGFAAEVPYTIAIIALDEGVHMLSNVSGPADAVRIDMPVEVWFDDVNEEVSLPKFRPVTP